MKSNVYSLFMTTTIDSLSTDLPEIARCLARHQEVVVFHRGLPIGKLVNLGATPLPTRSRIERLSPLPN